MDGIRLSKPDGWDDRSMIAFNAREMPQSGVLPNIVITQDHFGDIAGDNQVERIKAYADKQVSDMKAKLPNPVIHGQVLSQVAGRPAAEVTISWQNGATRLSQVVTFIARDAGKVMICTGTAAENDFDAHKASFREMLHSVQIAG